MAGVIWPASCCCQPRKIRFFDEVESLAIAAAKRTSGGRPLGPGFLPTPHLSHIHPPFFTLVGTEGEPVQASPPIRAVTGPSLTGPRTARHRTGSGFDQGRGRIQGRTDGFCLF